ncbi:GNAT family N-acetyltransferase [Undibacterium flavidum]|uniref:GNAT family N-acetyltransferase n=1 Tax=Undibacterium flavidum TaxID=2762297 RepID=A0ABR6YGI1_9BURK|nr:GNAT family N-acetyltransferase [Undibacterium flavidum]MBC3875670.1 GNAT family N-acetyltransferase [Undibacterium flavidum]
MTITIQRATVNELAIVAPLFNAYRVFYQQNDDLNLATKFLNERLQREESVIFFAIDNHGNGLGFVQLYPSFSSVSARRLWILNDLFVSESARRGGVARALMNQARRFAMETGAKGLFLETGRDNFQGQALYESLGYRKNSEFFYFLDLQNVTVHQE